MNESSHYAWIYSEIDDLPLYDLHNHLNPRSLAPSSFDDVIFYHYIVSELASAGMPWGDLEKTKGQQRLAKALDYAKFIRNTSTFWSLKRIAEDIYGVRIKSEKDLVELANAIEGQKPDASRATSVIRDKARVKRSLLTLNPLEAPPKYDRSLFAGALRLDALTYDLTATSLLALEKTTAVDLENGEALEEALNALFKAFGDLKALAFNPEPSDVFLQPTASQVGPHLETLRSRGVLKPESRRIISSYVLNHFLEEAGERELPVQMMIGVRRPVSGASQPDYALTDFDPSHLRELEELFSRYYMVTFDVFIGDPLLNHPMAVVAKNFSNVHLSGYWWYAMYPEYISSFLRTRIQMLPYNKFSGFFSDAYVADWVYGKACLAKKELARVLSEAVDLDYVDKETAIEVAKAVLYDNARSLYGERGNKNW